MQHTQPWFPAIFANQKGRQYCFQNYSTADNLIWTMSPPKNSNCCHAYLVLERSKHLFYPYILKQMQLTLLQQLPVMIIQLYLVICIHFPLLPYFCSPTSKRHKMHMHQPRQTHFGIFSLFTSADLQCSTFVNTNKHFLPRQNL